MGITSAGYLCLNGNDSDLCLNGNDLALGRILESSRCGGKGCG